MVLMLSAQPLYIKSEQQWAAIFQPQSPDGSTVLSRLHRQRIDQLMLAYCWLAPASMPQAVCVSSAAGVGGPLDGCLLHAGLHCSPLLLAPAERYRASCSCARSAVPHCIFVACIQIRMLTAAAASAAGPAAPRAPGQHPLKQDWLFCAMLCSCPLQCCMRSRVVGTRCMQCRVTAQHRDAEHRALKLDLLYPD